MSISPVKVWRNQRDIGIRAGTMGTVVSWTRIRVPQNGFSDQAPYPVAVVAFDDGTRMTVQVVDCGAGEPKTGMRVIAVIRRVRQPSEDGVIPYGIKVKPLGVRPEGGK